MHSIYLGAYLGTYISKISDLLLATHFLLLRSTEVKYLSNVPSLQFQIHRDLDSFWNLILPFFSTFQRNVLCFHVYLQMKGNNLCAWKQVNVSELGLVTPAGKVVWGEFLSFFKPSAFCACWSKSRTSFSCVWSLQFKSECLLCRTELFGIQFSLWLMPYWLNFLVLCIWMQGNMHRLQIIQRMMVASMQFYLCKFSL